MRPHVPKSKLNLGKKIMRIIRHFLLCLFFGMSMNSISALALGPWERNIIRIIKSIRPAIGRGQYIGNVAWSILGCTIIYFARRHRNEIRNFWFQNRPN